MENSQCVKRLRCSDPDLKIILKYTQGGLESETSYDMYGHILAGLSKFIDTALSVDMKEKATREITLQDVPPELFEKALKFQQDTSSIRSMSQDDALEVVEFYNKYEFDAGLRLCDDVLSDHLASDIPDDLGGLIEITMTVHKNNLPNSTEVGCKALRNKLKNDPLSAARLMTEQIKLLVPLFREYPSSLPPGFCPDDLECPLFPKYFRKSMSFNFLASSDSHELELKKDLEDTSAIKFRIGPRGWNVHGSILMAKGKSGDVETDWEIIVVSNPGRVHWRCPNSQDLDVPPYGPWEPVSATTSEILFLFKAD